MLVEEPVCRECLKEGIERQAIVVDHIVPLEWSRCDERWNKQGLCGPCHDEKSKRERAEGRPTNIAIAVKLRELRASFTESAEDLNR